MQERWAVDVQVAPRVPKRSQVPRAVDVHDPRGRARLGELVLRARASRAAAWIVVAFWLNLLAKQKVENGTFSSMYSDLISRTN